MTAIEELRSMAESVGLAMPQATTLMMEAADTIDHLDAKNAKLRDLCEWLLNPYRLGAVTGEGVDRQWCRETYDGGSYRLRELGGEVVA